jgi:hypothetical protein
MRSISKRTSKAAGILEDHMQQRGMIAEGVDVKKLVDCDLEVGLAHIRRVPGGRVIRILEKSLNSEDWVAAEGAGPALPDLYLPALVSRAGVVRANLRLPPRTPRG